jgi:hypothetical protein
MTNEISPLWIMFMVFASVIAAIIIATFIFSQAHIQEETAGYTDCNTYMWITDKYQSPSGYYFVSRSGSIWKVSEDEYKKWAVGTFLKMGDWEPRQVNVTFVNESESGYRNSCILNP